MTLGRLAFYIVASGMLGGVGTGMMAIIFGIENAVVLNQLIWLGSSVLVVSLNGGPGVRL